MTARRPSIEGVTFTGGEPTDQPEPIGHLAAFAWRLGLSVVVFTGRTLEQWRRDPRCAVLLANCDLVVAGPFVQSLLRRTAPLLGSANQKLHFLTPRYAYDDLRDVPDVEVLIASDHVAVSGVFVDSD